MKKYILKKISINLKQLKMSKVKDLKEVQDVDAIVAPEQDAEVKKPDAIIVELELAEALLTYLKTKPMNEVEQLAYGLAQCQGVTLSESKE